MVPSAKANVPERSCKACRAKKPKSELTRWVIKDGIVVGDSKQTMSGRGAYTCSQDCYDKIQKHLPKILKAKRTT